jgi:tetratricopeptide (TPR) repeat protein
MSVPGIPRTHEDALGASRSENDGEVLRDRTQLANASESELLVFICYRRSDGQWHADWIDRALNKWLFARPDGSQVRVRTYFDRTAPAVADWTKYHFPSLQSAHSLLVICTPGVAKDLSTPTKPDWVYKEIQWWLENRSAPPIVVDATGEGVRWMPERISQKWPEINRVPLLRPDADTVSVSENEHHLSRWRQQIAHTLDESQRTTVFENVARLDQLTKSLRLRAKILTGAVLAMALLAVAAVVSYSRANVSRETSQALNTFLGGLFHRADPDQMRGEALTAGQLLSAGVQELRLSQARTPVRIEMLTAIGAAYTGLGNPEKAIELLDEAQTLAEREPPSKHARFNLALARGEALLYQNRFGEARPLLNQALELSSSIHDAPHPERSYALVALGDLDAWAPDGDRDRASQRYEQALMIDTDIKDPINMARDRNRLGYLANRQRDLGAAESHLGAAVDLIQQVEGPSGSLLLAKYEHDYGGALYGQGDLVRAKNAFADSRMQLVAAYGADSGEVGVADNNLARVSIEQDELKGVEENLRSAVDNIEAEFGADYSDLAYALNNLGLVQFARGDLQAAGRNFARAQKIAEANEDSAIALQAIVHQSEIALANNDSAGAKVLLDLAKPHVDAAAPSGSWRHALFDSALGELNIERCELAAARELLTSSETTLSARWPWPNIFRKANERRLALLMTVEADQSRCRGRSHG